MQQKQWGITKLYQPTSTNPTASSTNSINSLMSEIVLQAYGFSPDDDLLEKRVVKPL